MNRGAHIGAAQAGAVLAWLRQREDEMAALLADFVAIPTENPPGKNYRACAALREIRMREFGLACQRRPPEDSNAEPDDAPVCLQASYGRGERALYFHG